MTKLLSALVFLFALPAFGGFPPAGKQKIPAFSSTTGTVSTSDTIEQAISKLDGNVGTKQATLSDAANIAYKDVSNTFTLANTFSSGILANDGSASAPAYSFTNSTNAGMYVAAGAGSTKALHLAAAGTDFMYFDAFTGLGNPAIIPQFRVLVNASGSAASPVFGFFSTGGLGIYNSAASELGIAAGGNAIAKFNSAGATVGGTSVILAPNTNTQASGTNVAVAITPTFNQTSSTAANTILKIDSTNTSVGSGAQNLIDGYWGGAKRFSISKNGTLLAGTGNAADETYSTATNSAVIGQSGVVKDHDTLIFGQTSVGEFGGQNSVAMGTKAYAKFVGTFNFTDHFGNLSTNNLTDSFSMQFANGWDFLNGASTNYNTGPHLRIAQAKVNTTDATQTTLQTLAVPTDATFLIEARITGKRTGGTAGATDDSGTWITRARAKNIAGTVTVTGVANSFSDTDQAWTVTITASGANALVKVTGAANNNITWHVTSIVSMHDL